jgi:hypothetical protein
LVLFCLGLLFRSRAGWERAAWGALAAGAAGQALWRWFRQRAA